MKFKTELQLVELEEDNFHLVISSLFKERVSGYWIVDTGASKTVFDLNLNGLYKSTGEETDQVHTAGIGEKPIKTDIGCLDIFTLGKLTIENLRVALLDLSHINKFYSQAAGLQICGLLGSDFLMKYNAVIDYKKKVLILKSKKSKW